MRIAATTRRGGVEDTITPQFGRAVTFTIVDYDGEIKDVEIVENTAASQPSGAGIAASQILVDRRVEAILTGNVGPKAMNVLKSAGIGIFRADGLKVGEAIERFMNGELEEIASPSRGMGGGKGRGTGEMGQGRKGGGRWR
ncbi:NifB/NifX family molybdenum-iron cluster-binding protein [Archaeoglobus neptunius]|uniref:NifB/NifX family molybdenum-iron cluster-binding protein n=1 Tax=Archaeoglobus neptunius TaxID=2798580 RepID=UPI0019285848|nr:NifB/NifX family molybdenum-iron cluster-binding protein [Archaeoglobus neptunius]